MRPLRFGANELKEPHVAETPVGFSWKWSIVKEKERELLFVSRAELINE